MAPNISPALSLDPSTGKPMISLSPEEDTFLSLLDEFAREGRKFEDNGVGEVECRIAGGWVRDKLLNLPSNDLDVTLSTTAGYPFAVSFIAWLRSLPPTHKSQIDLTTIGSIGKVAANPDQSKHLETATTKVIGLELDFVALRSETYADGSRIPSQVRLGTPKEDAERRDITINTLFYNVHTREVEDWTGQGIPDLLSGTIRTPLPPSQTFKDDPLRILRCLRFASRFGYELVDELKSTLGEEEILAALRTRISKERVGIEVEKMLKGPRPLLSIRLMTTSNPSTYPDVYPHIFTCPTLSVPPHHLPVPLPSTNTTLNARHTAEILSMVLPSGIWSSHVHQAIYEQGKLKPQGEKKIWLACCLAPYRGGMVKEKKRDVEMIECVIRDGLKLGNVDKNAVLRYYAASRALTLPKIDYEAKTIRSSLGLLLREPFIHDAVTDTHWTESVLFSLVIDLLPYYREGMDTLGPEMLDIFEQYKLFVQTVVDLGLHTKLDDKPLLDGNEINSVLGFKPSPLTRILMQRVVAWQLDHPTGTKQECGEWLSREKQEGRIEMPEKPKAKGKGKQ